VNGERQRDAAVFRDRTLAMAARLIAIAASIWLMFAPAVLDHTGSAANGDRIVGPIAGAFAFVACWDVLVAMRWATLPLGAWLALSPLLLDHTAAASASSVLAGVVFILTAPFGVDPRSDFAGGWRSVRPSAWSGGG
jgi:hypothetical protein